MEKGIVAAREEGIEAFVRDPERYSGSRFPEAHRVRYLENDPVAIEASWQAALEEGTITQDLSPWHFPCLIFVGAGDIDFHEQAQRTASELPNAECISIGDHDHLGAHLDHDRVLPALLRMMRVNTQESVRSGRVQR